MATLEAGGKIPIMVGRHSFIGPYRIQPAWAKLDMASRASGEFFMRVPTQTTEKLIAGGEAMDVPVTMLTGLHGDLDDDRFISMVIGDKKAHKAIEDLLSSGAHMSEYKKWAAEYAYRMKLVKARSASAALGPMEDIERLVSGSQQLRVGVGKELGSLSLALNEAKVAMHMHGAPGAAKEFFSLGEIFEENLIMAKHGLSQNMSAEVTSALRNIENSKSIETLANSFRQVFGEEITKDVQMQMGNMKWTMKGINPERFWEDVQTSMKLFRSSPAKIMYDTMIRGNESAIRKVPVKKMVNLLEQAARGEVDPLSALATRGMETKGASTAGKIIGEVNNSIREMGAATRRSFGKPMLWSMGLALAASMIVGPPEGGTLTPPPPPPPRKKGANLSQAQNVSIASMKAYERSTTRDLRPESMGGVHGNPRNPPMPSPNTYMTNSPPLNHRANGGHSYKIVASGANVDAGQMRRLLSQYGNNGNISVNDNRRNLTSQNLSDLLEGF